MKRLVLLAITIWTCLLISFVAQADVFIGTISSSNQIGAAGYPLPNPLWYKVEKDGVRLKNHPISFRVIEGGGHLFFTDTVTDKTGRIKNYLVLGSNAGVNIVETTVNYNGTDYTHTISARAIRPITDIFNRTSCSTPNIWRKFIGEDAPDGTPDLIDHSYAGYKNGEEGIPVATGIIYDVTDYGAIPNDDQSDTRAIRDAIRAAENGGIVLFPAGQYDILLDGESVSKIYIGRNGGRGNIVLRGSGSQGAERKGTTIKMHNHIDGHWNCLFEGAWQHNGSNQKTQILGTFPKGTKHFDVVDSSSLIGKKFLIITASGLYDEQWDHHSARSRSEIKSYFTNIRNNGIGIKETHEIDRIEGNRVYIKAPTITPLDSNYFVYWKNLQVGIGFEDIHFDGNLQERYVHLQQEGRNWISLKNTAHSWVQRCRFSNSIIGVWIDGYANSAISMIFDGRNGHYPSVLVSATYCFIGLLEDHTDNGMSHGVSITSKSAGNVVWGIGGPVIDGPDTHGAQPRYTLYDNYSSQTHDSSSGRFSNLPHHLDGYTRWNNIVNQTRTVDLWTTNPGYFFVTQSSLIGYIQNGGSSPRNRHYTDLKTCCES